MPKMDGLSVMEMVGGDKDLKKQPDFIVVTAVGQERITEDAFRKGAKLLHHEAIQQRDGLEPD